MNLDSHIDTEKKIQNKLSGERFIQHQKYSMKNLFKKHANILLHGVSDSDTILDVGCGVGDIIALAAKKTKKRVVGIDVSDQCVNIANNRFFSENILNACAETYDIQSSCDDIKYKDFDRVLMKGVIHHLHNQRQAFCNIYNILKPGGSLYILEGNVMSKYRSLVLYMADLAKIQHEASQFNHTPYISIIDHLEEIGFKNISITFVPGVFAPFAYIGIGGKYFWNFANRVESVCNYFGSNFFGWWVALNATK
jgi:2-polyprenyl-3-methyl-5-hydroxy-6-metoxy-1,4-benzoquinol methylase